MLCAKGTNPFDNPLESHDVSRDIHPPHSGGSDVEEMGEILKQRHRDYKLRPLWDGNLSNIKVPQSAILSSNRSFTFERKWCLWAGDRLDKTIGLKMDTEVDEVTATTREREESLDRDARGGVAQFVA